MTINQPDTVYGANAYDSKNTPKQRPPKRNHFGALSQPLAWGDPQEILPIGFMGSTTPKTLKQHEDRDRADPHYRERMKETLNAVFNHQRYRYTPLQGWTQLWIYMHGLGKWAFIILFSLLIVTTPLLFFVLHEGSSSEKLTGIAEFSFWILAPCSISWLIGYLVLKFVPERYLLKPSRKGPVWEMNRQTGMVTIFARKKGQFRKLGFEGDFVAPFYEFDAAIHTIADRQGFPLHMLNLVHRYHVAAIDFSVLMGKVGIREHCVALWDFWQRYMDISQPIPDIPELEFYRHLDPTTAEHDQRTGRSPRYWRDMDMKTFKAKIDEITDVTKVNMQRPNLMAQYMKSA